MTEKKEVEKITLPEGRLLNRSLFVRDQFDEKATPSYKLELAFDREALDDIAAKLAAFAKAKWGAGADDDYYDGKIRDPILDGDAMAQKRADKEKPGEAYVGKDIIRAHTKFNKHGVEGPGGIQVFGPDVLPIEEVESHEVYPGCYGQALVTIGAYTESASGRNALMFYLSAFQKTRDGEPLISAADHSSAFKAVGRDQEGGTEGRRRRPG